MSEVWVASHREASAIDLIDLEQHQTPMASSSVPLR